MKTWWDEANDLLVAQKCYISTFESMVQRSNVGFRETTMAFFELLERAEVPLLIFSAGIAELIDRVILHFMKKTYSNAHVVSNHVKTDKDGLIIGFAEPVIHTFNKNEMSISHSKTTTWFESVSHRQNVILVGDSLGDAGMATGVSNIGTIIKIGFLNHDIDKNLQHYKTVYDVLILNDGTFDFVLELVKSVIGEAALVLT